MMIPSMALVSTFLILGFIFSEAKPAPPPPQRPTVFHSWLVHQWPAAYCSINQCKLAPLPRNLILHGLWPADDQGNLIENCVIYVNVGFLFIPKPEGPRLYNSLMQHWPSLEAAANDSTRQISFWSHEYTKHGSCFPGQHPKAYFPKAIRLKTKISLNDVLTAAQINPGGPHPRTAFDTAVQQRWGSSDVMVMKCFRRINQTILQEITICLDGNAVDVVHCSTKELNKDSCGRGPIMLL